MIYYSEQLFRGVFKYMDLALTFFATSAATYWLHFLINRARIATDSSPHEDLVYGPSSRITAA